METLENKVENYVKEAYRIAAEHGFHDKELPDGHYLCLIMSEISEAVEAHRKSKRAQRAMFDKYSVDPQPNQTDHEKYCFETFVKDTVEDELADAAIRLFDYAYAKYGSDYRYIQTKDISYSFCMHSFPETAYHLVKNVLGPSLLEIGDAITFVYKWSYYLGFNIDWHIEKKMWYNELRQRKHGKNY